MVNITINNTPLSVPEGINILEAARIGHIHIPHLCYLKELNEIAACRLCCVEVEGTPKLVPACNTTVFEGMVVVTNSPRVKEATRTNLELIMSQHECKCAVCVRNGNCQLQKLADDYNLVGTTFEEDLPSGKLTKWNRDFPLIRDTKKCIKCMRCVQVCDKVQGLGVWDLVGTGSRTQVNVSQSIHIEESDCSLCGQCITHCPVGALYERNDENKVLAAIHDPKITTVVQIAPAVRAAWGESLGLSPKEATVEKMAGVLRALGFDYVFDTSYSADLTIMEEANEFIERFTGGELKQYPMFTSCCPGWISYVHKRYPKLLGQLSTAKSPQQMFGAIVKSYFAQRIGVAPEQICCVSIMPCVAKKRECDLPTMRNKDGIKDVDYALTTRELISMIRAQRLSMNGIEESKFDHFLGEYTGAGVIFGTTGGVMEAALRSAYYFITGENPTPETFEGIRKCNEEENPLIPPATARGGKAWREKMYTINDITVKVAIVNGLGNAGKLCDAILKGTVSYDFVEVMACPSGCSGGGGQPIHTDDVERGYERGDILYSLDKNKPLRFSHENKEVIDLYRDFLGKPLGEKSEELLHTKHV